MLDARHHHRRAGLAAAVAALIGVATAICGRPGTNLPFAGALADPIRPVVGTGASNSVAAAPGLHSRTGSTGVTQPAAALRRSPSDQPPASSPVGAAPFRPGYLPTSDPAARGTTAPARQSSPVRQSTTGATDDAALVEKLVGRWCREKFGRRLLEVKPDGTARLTVEPSGFWKTLFGERLCVDIEWSLKDGRISYRAKSGEPADKVRLATRLWGSAWTEIIESIDDRAAILRDVQTQEISKWTRLPAKPSAAAPR
ncbi:MAG: hypothetical protein D6725_10115 [Planctomycetota bacterium]|nr:MAG: hypothetical protein D6725_10115 [Planctomycetota bacterium]